MKGKNKKWSPLYFSVKDICKILAMKPYTLDYWEKHFPEIKPYKIGRRNFYKKEQLELLLQIKNLLEDGYNLEGVRKKLFKPSKVSKEEKKRNISLFPELKVKFSELSPSHQEDFSESQSEATLRRKKSLNFSDKKDLKLKKILKEVLKELKEIYQQL